jgi:hypothetical protein
VENLEKVSVAMNKISALSLVGLLVASLMFSQFASAATDCEAQAVGKNGRPLVGKAKLASVKKCTAAAKKLAQPDCTGNPVDEYGNALVGAAKEAFLKRCRAAPVARK